MDSIMKSTNYIIRIMLREFRLFVYYTRTYFCINRKRKNRANATTSVRRYRDTDRAVLFLISLCAYIIIGKYTCESPETQITQTLRA